MSLGISAAAWAGIGAVGSIGVGMMSANAQQDAANTASNAQVQSSQMATAEQQRQFDAVQKLLKPYVDAGTSSLGSQQDLAGANGPEAQQKAIAALQQTPAFTSQLRLGENRLLANASATGGLRGGNTQAALGYFAPQLLAQTINDQYGRLGGLTSIGENAAAMTGNAGMQTGNNISSLLMAGGNAQANGALLGGVAQSKFWSGLPGIAGQLKGAGFFNGFGGGGGGIPMPDAIALEFAGMGGGAGNYNYGGGF